MPNQVTMPRLDKDMEEGRIATWHRAEGDKIAKGDVLFEIETDKAAVEVEAEHDGHLHHIAFPSGESAPVDSVVAWIYAADEEVGSPPEAPAPAPASAAPDESTPSAQKPAPQARAPREPAPRPASAAAPSGGRVLATPAARAEAESRGLPLEGMTGTGPAARIQKSDVLAAADATTPDSAAPPLQPENPPGPLSVLSTGGGDRLPMVMIHGLLADASGWDKLAKPLGRDRPVHRIELPCHGRSPLGRIADFADLVRYLRHAFDGIDTERCHLVGHSLGGALALALADTRPRRIASLTLIAPAGLGPEINGDAVAGMCRATRADSLGPWMKRLTADPDAIGWSYVKAAAAGRRDPALRAAQSALADALFPDGVQAFDMRAALERLDMPTRIIWGREDHMIPWRHALHAPGHVALNLFRAVGHMPHYEIPEQIEPLLAQLP